jgi:hypothetical protein
MNEDFVVTRPKYRKIDGSTKLVPGTGALPPGVGDSIRVFINVMFSRLLNNIRAKAMCATMDYDPVVASTVKNKTTGEAYHFVGGETSYDEAVTRDLAHLRATWAALGIDGPSDEELHKMAGLVWVD